MKRYLAALALFTALMAVAGQAFADHPETWHCIAHPPGFSADTHDGFGGSRDDARDAALDDCREEHHVKCVIASCNQEH